MCLCVHFIGGESCSFVDIYAFIFCAIFKNSCYNTLFNFVSIFPHVSQFRLKYLIAIIFHIIFIWQQKVGCSKNHLLQRFLFVFFYFLVFFFMLENKFIHEHNFSPKYQEWHGWLHHASFFLVQNFSSLEMPFFHHFFAIVFSWKQLPLKLLFRKLWNWSHETNALRNIPHWNEFEWNQLKIVYFSLRRKANKFELKTNCVNESADHRPCFVMTHNNEYIHNSSALPYVFNCLFYLTSW